MSSPEQEGTPENGTNAAKDNVTPSPSPAAPLSDLSEPNNSSSSSSSSSGSDSEHSDKNSQHEYAPGGRNRDKLTTKMLNLCREILITVCVGMAYAALTNENPPKVSKSPAAYPFFPEDSLVVDWYKGQITEAIEQARMSDISFVMFYAPWDAESQAARIEFEKTAIFMHQQVAFGAINCWQPKSECRKQYSKVYKWPVLIAYPAHGRGIQYNGPLESTHMIKFLQNICRPLISPEKINDVIAKHDVVVLGNVDLSPGSLEFAAFYLTALRFLERDPFKDVGFAVMPPIGGEPKLHLFLWNRTLVYDGAWNPDAINSWLLKNLDQASFWVSPSGTKSLSLSKHIQPGPTVVLFTPKNPLLHQVDYYDMLKEIAYEYRNCGDVKLITLKQKLIQLGRMRNRVKQRDLRVKCLGYLSKQAQEQEGKARDAATPVTFRQKPKTWLNSSVLQIPCGKHTLSCDLLGKQDDNTCQDFTLFPSQIKNEDRKSPVNLKQSQHRDTCRNFLVAEKYTRTIFEPNFENHSDFNVNGLACRENRSLAFVAMDSLRYHHFAEKFGVNLLKKSDKSAVLIVDEKLETYYIMDNPVSGLNVRMFIRNFTDGTLGRSLTSTISNEVKKTHVYPHKTNSNYTSEVHVKELSSMNFLPVIQQQNKAVLVLYYSKQCAFCSGFSHVYLNVLRLFRDIKEIVFTRIDGDLQSLPWEYTMETYPTILFFPALKKSESRAFPRTIPLTVPNLIGFIFTNLDPVLKLKAMWMICRETNVSGNCISSVRSETLGVISRTLKEWRLVDAKDKPKVIHKLQVLRDLHLLFAHSPQKTEKINYYLSKLHGIIHHQQHHQNSSKMFNNIRDEL